MVDGGKNGKEAEERKETQQDCDLEKEIELKTGWEAVALGGGLPPRQAAFMRKPSIQSLVEGAQDRISKASRFNLRVRLSHIHRLGVFAGKQIPAKAKVIQYAGERIGRQETRRRFLEICRGRDSGRNYLAKLNSYWAIDGAVGGNGAELINHRCQPNLALRGFRGGLWLVSLRRIRKGEELAFDYKFNKNGIQARCRCGSPNCRGTINVR